MSELVDAEKRERTDSVSKEKRDAIEDKKRKRKHAVQQGLKEGLTPEQLAEDWSQCCCLLVGWTVASVSFRMV
jgi:hypothetical protein